MRMRAKKRLRYTSEYYSRGAMIVRKFFHDMALHGVAGAVVRMQQNKVK